MKPIRVEPEAKDELAAAAAWYESRRPGLGHQFIIAVDAVFAAIARDNTLFLGVSPGAVPIGTAP